MLPRQRECGVALALAQGRRGAGVGQAWFIESLLTFGNLKLGETYVGEVMNVCLSSEGTW